MKNIFLKCVLALCASAVMFDGCAKKEIEDEGGGINEDLVNTFVVNEIYGVYDSNATPLFVMDFALHELVYNTAQQSFVIQDEGLKPLFRAELSSSVGDMYNVVVDTEVQGIEKGSFRMKCVKTEGDMIWLWDAENRMGIITLCD